MTQNNTAEHLFSTLGIAPKLLAILQAKNFITPTPIQHQCIPSALEGKDIVGIAQTGTGKTLAFAVPILQRLAQVKGQALVLVPTRELALQVDDMIRQIGASLGLKSVVIIGGASANMQMRALRNNPHVVIATPGRLIDHLSQNIFSLKNVNMIVLDEADRMLDIGFLPDIKRILEQAPKERQTLLFSATMPQAIAQIALKFMKMPLRIEVAPSGTAAEGVEQEIFIVDKQAKLPLLEKVLAENSGSVLVFARTKYSVKKITRVVNAMSHSATEIHSNRSLAQRTQAMAGFKSGAYRVLVATDIASRGIDVSDITLVVNYDLPENSEDYVHRIGRTGRAGLSGKAISFATPDQRGDIKQIERLIKQTIPILSLPKLAQSSDAVMRALYVDDRSDRPSGSGRTVVRGFRGTRSSGGFAGRRPSFSNSRRRSGAGRRAGR
ncbi:MAG: ATP-dependent RNA helicase RhlE [Parcubacteria group bacterium CG_4_10_14_0_2_um_filter_41_6]|nr:MAG: ATP-dependent RNA helicase RhlE [Parcubacteria group bacterium CG_4_10_14_0_2_um_filter_41_6]